MLPNVATNNQPLARACLASFVVGAQPIHLSQSAHASTNSFLAARTIVSTYRAFSQACLLHTAFSSANSGGTRSIRQPG